jgi:hypothetical protein
MTYIEYVAERDGMLVRMALRRTRIRDWAAVARLWSQIVWRSAWGGGRLDARTAWEVAAGVVGIVRDPHQWQDAQHRWAVRTEGRR